MAVQTLLQVRRGTTSEWISANPTLSAGEWGLDTSLRKYKIGDGLTAWNSLPYASILPNSSDLVGTSGIGISFSATTGTPVTVSVTGILSSQINDFNAAVDARVTAASVSEEQVQDIVASGDHLTTGFLRNGTGVVINYDDASNFVSINVSGYSLLNHTHSSSDITDFGEASQDAIGTNAGSSGFLRNGSGVAWTYDDGGNTLTIGVTGIPSSLITDFASAVSDQVDTTLAAGTGVVLNYNSGTDTLTIHTSGYSLLNHTHVWSNITDASSIVTTGELAYLSGVVAGTASSNRAVVLDGNKNINGIGSITTTGNVIVGGDLTVQGTTTTVNSTTVDIGDNIIQVNVSGAETQGGLQVYDHDNTIARSIVWDISDNRWEFTGGNVYTSGDFISDSLQVTSTDLVTNLNADLLDGEHGSYYRNFASLTGLPDPIITGTLTGDVTGSSSVTLTDLGNGTLSISTTLSDNTVTSAKIVNGTIVDEDINASAAIAVTKLASSGITLGSTNINLGQTSSVIDGLTRISGVSALNPTYIYYAIIDGGSP
jgi:hypothetical protein